MTHVRAYSRAYSSTLARASGSRTMRTNWDQGHVSLATLQTHLSAILTHERVIGVDICGECSTLLDLAEEQAEAAQNDSVNERLLRLLSIKP